MQLTYVEAVDVLVTGTGRESLILAAKDTRNGAGARGLSTVELDELLGSIQRAK